MALTIVLMLLGGVIGGCVGAFAVLIWADGLPEGRRKGRSSGRYDPDGGG